jgi:hypothetical protein
MMLSIPMPHFGVQVKGSMPQPDLQRARQALEREMRAVGTLIQQTWVAVAQKRDVNRTGAYLAAIQRDGAVTVRLMGDEFRLTGEVKVTNDAPHARIVEEGHGAFHLPDRINWAGAKVKVSKSGRRYMHIPFRHFAYATPEKRVAGGLSTHTLKQMMPKSIYNRAQRLKVSTPLLQGPQHDAQGRYRAADRYKWGGRLRVGQSASMGATGDFRQDPKTGEYYEHQRGQRSIPNVRMADGSIGRRENPAWQAPKHEGMFRTKRPSGRGSRYFTIRTITQDSPGWNIPALAGKHIAADVATILRTPQGIEKLRRRMIAAVRENIT